MDHSSFPGRWLALLLFVFPAVFGCQGAASDNGPDANSDPQANSATTPDASEGADEEASISIELQRVDRAALDAVIQAKAGDVVVVDFWATWCEPCKERFPHMIELLQQHQPRGLAMVTLSCDEDDAETGVRAFLAEQKAIDSINLMTSLDLSTTFEKFEIPEAIPYYLLYDRQGKLRYRFSLNPDAGGDMLSVDELEDRVLELLGE